MIHAIGAPTTIGAAATAERAEAPAANSLPRRIGTIALVGGVVTGLSALAGRGMVTKAAAMKGMVAGGIVGALLSASLIAATGIGTRSGGTFGSGAAGSAVTGAGGVSGPPFSG